MEPPTLIQTIDGINNISEIYIQITTLLMEFGYEYLRNHIELAEDVSAIKEVLDALDILEVSMLRGAASQPPLKNHTYVTRPKTRGAIDDMIDQEDYLRRISMSRKQAERDAMYAIAHEDSSVEPQIIYGNILGRVKNKIDQIPRVNQTAPAVFHHAEPKINQTMLSNDNPRPCSRPQQQYTKPNRQQMLEASKNLKLNLKNHLIQKRTNKVASSNQNQSFIIEDLGSDT